MTRIHYPASAAGRLAHQPCIAGSCPFPADAIWLVSTVNATNMFIPVGCVAQINGSFPVWTHQHNSIRTRFVEYFMLILLHPVGVLTRFTLTHSSPFHKSQSLFNSSLIRVVKWRKYPLPSWNCKQLPFRPYSRVYKIEETTKSQFVDKTAVS